MGRLCCATGVGGTFSYPCLDSRPLTGPSQHHLSQGNVSGTRPKYIGKDQMLTALLQPTQRCPVRTRDPQCPQSPALLQPEFTSTELPREILTEPQNTAVSIPTTSWLTPGCFPQIHSSPPQATGGKMPGHNHEWYLEKPLRSRQHQGHCNPTSLITQNGATPPQAGCDLPVADPKAPPARALVCPGSLSSQRKPVNHTKVTLSLSQIRLLQHQLNGHNI